MNEVNVENSKNEEVAPKPTIQVFVNQANVELIGDSVIKEIPKGTKWIVDGCTTDRVILKTIDHFDLRMYFDSSILQACFTSHNMELSE